MEKDDIKKFKQLIMEIEQNIKNLSYTDSFVKSNFFKGFVVYFIFLLFLNLLFYFVHMECSSNLHAIKYFSYFYFIFLFFILIILIVTISRLSLFDKIDYEFIYKLDSSITKICSSILKDINIDQKNLLLAYISLFQKNLTFWQYISLIFSLIASACSLLISSLNKSIFYDQILMIILFSINLCLNFGVILLSIVFEKKKNILATAEILLEKFLP